MQPFCQRAFALTRQKQSRPFAACTRPTLSRPLAPEVVPGAVAKILRSFPAHTVPGPSGLRVQHLREATPAKKANALFQHLASVVGLLAQGQAYPAAAAAFAGGSLIALPKPKDGVCPHCNWPIFAATHPQMPHGTCPGDGRGPFLASASGRGRAEWGRGSYAYHSFFR